MFYPILLSMIAAAPVGVPANEPDPTIRITLNNEGQYLPGDRAKVQVITRDDGYLVVFRVSPEGKLRVLFPLDPTDDNYVKGGKRYLLLGRGGREGFTVDAGGTGVVFAAVSLDPWRFSAYVQNDHWDFAALNTVTYEDTETDLVNLAQAMASGRFDYDIIGYTVASQQVAAVDEQADAGAGQRRCRRHLFRLLRHVERRVLRLWLLQQHLWSLRPLLLLSVLQLRPVLPGVGLWPNLWLGLGLGGMLRLLLQRQRLSAVLPAVSYGGTVHALPEEVVGSHLEWLGAAVPSAGRERLQRDEYRLRSAAGDRRTAASALPGSDLGEQCGWRGGRHVGGKAGHGAGVEDDEWLEHEWLERDGWAPA